MPPVDPSNGCVSFSPLLWRGRCPERTAGGLGRTSDDFVPSLEFQVGSCLYVTAAVKAASQVGTAYVAAAAEVCSRSIGTCGSLSFSSLKSCLPSGRRVCVTLGVIGILLDFNLFYRRGGPLGPVGALVFQA